MKKILAEFCCNYRQVAPYGKVFENSTMSSRCDNSKLFSGTAVD